MSARPPVKACASPSTRRPRGEPLELTTRPVAVSTGQIPCPPPGNSRDRHRAGFTTAPGPFLLALDSRISSLRRGKAGLVELVADERRGQRPLRRSSPARSEVMQVDLRRG